MRYFFFALSVILLLFGNSFLYSQISTLNVHLDLNDAIYNPMNDRIYASCAGTQKHGNSILVINPTTLIIEDSVHVHSEPSHLVFNDDYSTLYVGYAFYNGLDKIDIPTMKLIPMVLFNDVSLQYLASFHDQGKEIVLGIHREGFHCKLVCINDTTTIYHTNSYQNATGLKMNGSYFLFHDNGAVEYKFIEGNFIIINTWQFTFYIREFYNFITKIGDLIFFNKSSVLEFKNNEFKIVNPITNDGVVGFDGEVIYKTIFNGEILTFNKETYQSSLLLNHSFGSIGKWIYLGGPGRMAFIIFHNRGSSTKGIPETRAQLVVLKTCPELTPNLIQASVERLSNCQNTNVIAKVANPKPNTRYIWSFGMEGDSVSCFPNYAFSQCFVTEVDSSGCITGKSQTQNIINVQIPDDITINYNSVMCYNKKNTLVASAGSGAKYIWSTGQTGSTITVSEPGEYKVTATFGNLCPNYSLNKTVNITELKHIPKPKLFPEGFKVICPGENITVYTDDVPFGRTWTGNFFSKNNGRAIIRQAGTYSLKYNMSTCFGEENQVIVIEDTKPSRPILNFSNGFLKASTLSDSLLWYRNGKLIPDFHDKQLPVSDNAVYSVIAVSEKGCKSDSREYSVQNYGNYPILCKVVVDLNNNMIFDSFDYLIQNTPVTITELNKILFTSNDGTLGASVPQGTYTLDMKYDTSMWLQTYPHSPHVVHVTNTFDSVYTYFITPKKLIDNVLTTGHSDFTRCNRLVRFYTHVINKGTSILKGNLCVTLDPRIEKIQINGSEINVVNNVYCFEVKEIGPTQQRTFEFSYLVPSPASGTEISFNINFHNSANVVLHSSKIQYTIRCSYDPNDKNVVPKRGDNLDLALFSDDLIYTIRFQNTGNDTAFYVRLEDNLSADLEWESFRPLFSSHKSEAILDKNTGKLIVIYTPIALVDSSTNIDLSQGFFTFSIKPKTGLDEFTSVDNLAEIYFDYNPAILTNKVTLQLVSQISTSNDFHPYKNQILIYPNPTNNQITFKTDFESTIHLEILDELGHIIYANYHHNQEFLVDLSNWKSGLYLYKIEYKDTKYSGRIIKH